MLFWNPDIKNRPAVFTSTCLGKNPLTRQTRRTFNRSRSNLNRTIRNTFIIFCRNQLETILAPGFPRALDLSPLHAQKSSGSRLPAGLKNDCACALICGNERRLKRAPVQNDCCFAGNKQAAFKSKNKVMVEKIRISTNILKRKNNSLQIWRV